MQSYLTDLERSAREILPAAVYRYFSQGAGDGISADEAVAAWRRLRFRPHVLRDVSEVSLGTSLLGSRVASPLAIAPTSLQRHAHPLGEAEMARGAAAAGSLLCVSSNAGLAFAEIADAGGPELSWWVQVYVLRDRELTARMLDRAVSAGCTAVVLTADTPVVATKGAGGADVWDRTPPDFLHANEDLGGVGHREVEKARDLVPRDVGWLAELTGLPIVVKGVLRPDDAVEAVDAGASAVWVSNHGGRQLDRSIPTASALQGVATAVGETAEVYVDGGVRNGLDVMAALALGAHAVFLGRPALWALAVGGAAGVATLLDSVALQLAEAMALCGAPTLGDLTSDLLAGGRGDEPVGYCPA